MPKAPNPMQEVVCPKCNSTVHISPDAARCSVCGEPLRHLLEAEYASGHFYKHAAELAAGGDVITALSEAKRGLAYRDTPELRLLSAILSKKLGNYEEVRQHVAAIPVDDALRSEAEWLLRSDDRRRRGRGNEPRRAKRGAAPVGGALPSDDPLAFTLAELYPERPRPSEPAGERRRGFPWLITLAVILIGAVALFFFDPPAFLQGPDAAPAAGIADAPTAAPPAQASPAAPAAGEDQPAPPAADPTATPTVAAPQSGPVDLLPLLTAAGRPELAQLGVTAQRDGSRITLAGSVASPEQRDAIAAAVGALPGVTEVDSSAVSLAVPSTYTVVSGDTLWSIAVQFYGDAAAMQAILDVNPDTLTNPEAIGVGMVLNMPPAPQATPTAPTAQP